MERSRPRLVRVPTPGIAVPGDVPDQPGGGREAQGRLVGGRGRGDASLGGADPLRSDGSRAGLLRDRRDPATHRQHHGRGGILRAGSRDRLRPAARAGPPPLRPREERSRAAALRVAVGPSRRAACSGPGCWRHRSTSRSRCRTSTPRPATDDWMRSLPTWTHRSWPRARPRRGERSSSLRGTDSGARNPSAGVLDLAGDFASPTKRPELGCSTDSPFERPGTRTARDPSSTPRCPRSNDSARARMLVPRRPISTGRTPFRVGSPNGRPRSCASWRRARRTGTSPPCS